MPGRRQAGAAGRDLASSDAFLGTDEGRAGRFPGFTVPFYEALCGKVVAPAEETLTVGSALSHDIDSISIEIDNLPQHRTPK